MSGHAYGTAHEVPSGEQAGDSDVHGVLNHCQVDEYAHKNQLQQTLSDPVEREQEEHDQARVSIFVEHELTLHRRVRPKCLPYNLIYRLSKVVWVTAWIR